MAKTEQRTCTVQTACEDARNICEELQCELQDWYDNLPASFQGGEKGDQLDEAINALQEVMDALDEVIDNDIPEQIRDYAITYSQIIFPKSTYMSRAKRLQLDTCALEGIPTELPEDLEDVKLPADFGEGYTMEEFWEQMYDAVSTATDALSSIEFPTR